MKRAIICSLLLLVFLGKLSQALAWEFKMTADAEWRYRYISRTGPGDLFGDANLAQQHGTGTSIGFAGPQSQAVRLEGYSSKGSDAAYGEQRFWFFPEFRINPALRLRSVLAFQGNVNANYSGGGPNWITNPHYSGWIMMDSRDLYTGTGLAVPAVRAFWGTAQTPLGIIAIGTRPGGFGMGWVLHQDDSYARSIALIVPWGPFNIILSQYLHSNFERTDPNDDRNSRRSGYTIASAVDQNEVFKYNTAVAVTYKSTGLECGSLLYFIRSDNRHGWPQGGYDTNGYPLGATYQDDIGANFSPVAFGSAPALSGLAHGGNVPMYVSAFMTMGIAYVNYTDGKFFLNAEYDFMDMNVRRDGGRPISGFAQAWAAEVGALFGPAKLTLANFYRSGHDRRGGYYNLSWPTGSTGSTSTRAAFGLPSQITNVSDQYTYFLGTFLGGGDSPINPYAFLMGLYGGGNNAYNSTGACNWEDILAYCARLDYAVAANLNVFASFVYAQRASNTGTPQGLYTGTWAPRIPNQSLNSQYGVGYGAFGSGQANAPGTGGGTGLFPIYQDGPGRPQQIVANVPDNDLGWEFDAGFQWKLLEGMTFKLLFAYWQPGKWFNWAYSDMTLANPTPTAVNQNAPVTYGTYGVVNPARTISPIMAWQGNLLMQF